MFSTAEQLEVRRGQYVISTDRSRLDMELIHRFLSERAYWALGRDLETVRRSIDHSLRFGVHEDGLGQVGFARVVSDYATFAWLCDVFVVESHRGLGLGGWLIETIVAHPSLQGLKRFTLATGNAHKLYRRFGGFGALQEPGRWMERSTVDVVEPAGSGSEARVPESPLE